MVGTATTDCRMHGSRHRRAVSKKRTGDGGVCQQTLIFNIPFFEIWSEANPKNGLCGMKKA